MPRMTIEFPKQVDEILKKLAAEDETTGRRVHRALPEDILEIAQCVKLSALHQHRKKCKHDDQRNESSQNVGPL